MRHKDKRRRIRIAGDAFWILPGLSLAFCLAIFPAHSYQVVGQESGAAPIQQVIGDLLDRFSEHSEQEEYSKEPTPPPRTVPAPDALPLTSTLSPQPGTRTIRLSLALTAPVCVIGSETLSRSWIEANRARLHEFGARCVLVQAQTKRDVETMTRLAAPVPVSVLPFDDLAELHGITAYPVLIVGSRQ